MCGESLISLRLISRDKPAKNGLRRTDLGSHLDLLTVNAVKSCGMSAVQLCGIADSLIPDQGKVAVYEHWVQQLLEF